MPAALAPAPNRSRRRVFALTLFAAITGVLAFSGVASADFLTPESGGSPQADSIDNLYKIILAVAVVVFVGVEGVLLYSLVKFRARKGAVPAQIRGNTRLEIGWTLGAAFILVVLAVVTFAMLPGIRNPRDSDADGFPTRKIENVQNASAYQPRPPSGRALNVEVNGQRYAWRYTYPDGDTNTLNNVFSYTDLVVPTKTTVVLTIKAQDVAHSWWVPALGGKFDAVPGHLNFTWFKVGEPGTFRGQCAELCGRNHADMVARVVAMAPAEFKQWLADKQRDIDAANKDAPEAACRGGQGHRAGRVTRPENGARPGRQVGAMATTETAVLVPEITAHRVEPEQRGWVSWVTTTDHKRIGILYLVTTFVFFLLGGVEALLMRVQLGAPDNTFLTPETYNALFTLHGTTMIFLFVVPVMAGFGNYFLPLMIGARDMAFPKLNALSYWLLLAGGIVFYVSLFFSPPEAGWTSYAPLSSSVYAPNGGIDAWIFLIHLTGISSLLGAINFYATIANMRAPGHGLGSPAAVRLVAARLRDPADPGAAGDRGRGDIAADRPALRHGLLRPGSGR